MFQIQKIMEIMLFIGQKRKKKLMSIEEIKNYIQWVKKMSINKKNLLKSQIFE